MCDCAEIQGQFQPQLPLPHDFITDWGVWLPRQDQLQDMVAPLLCDCHDAECLLIDFYRYIESCTCNPILTESMEQMWLAFYMRIVWGKAWIDEEGIWE